MKDFLNIAITDPRYIKDEEMLIPYLLDYGFDYVHIRKHDWEKDRIETLIRSIPEVYHPKLKLHSCFELCDKYELGGVHLNHRNAEAPDSCHFKSRSCHSIEELSNNGEFEYQFLSPIYNSISKENYHGNFNLEEITQTIRGKKVVALGGITPDKFEELKKTGFIGAALLGYIWQRFS